MCVLRMLEQIMLCDWGREAVFDLLKTYKTVNCGIIILIITYDGATIIYDNNGNMTSSKYEEDTDDEYIITQTFDLLDRMTDYESPETEAEYTYYPDNKRESKSVSEVSGVLPILQGTGNQPMSGGGSGLNPNPINHTNITTHIWLGDEIAFDITASSVVKYLHGIKLIESDFGLYLYDAHGNVTGILDSNYDISQSYTYDPFGADIVSAAESEIRDDEMQSLIPSAGIMSSGIQIGYIPENPYRYCGEYTDTETGYVYLRARYYDPTIGRFISEDSAKDGYNWYVYCGNDPVNYVDPSGKFAFSTFLIGLAVSSIISFAAGKILGNQFVGGISSISNGYTSITTGISLLSFGPVGWLLGGTAIIAGVAAIAFGTAEIQESFDKGNWIKDSFHISEGLYNGLYLGSNLISSAATIGGNVYRNYMTTYSTSQAPTTPQKPYSRFYQTDNLGHTKSITQFNKLGLPQYRIDVQGRPHKGILPHIHTFSWNSDGYKNGEGVRKINYTLWNMLGNWR